MKVHNYQSSTSDSIEDNVNNCCGTDAVTANRNADPCCEQPTDGSSCCDKSASQEENSKTTGCC